MSAVQNNTVSTSLMEAMNGTKAGKNKDDVNATQDRFMTLLVTQMRNQDPLNPMDNAQMTSQLAQLSTVSGIEKLNSTLVSMMGSFQSNQSMQAASMIGHGVLVPGSSVELFDSQAILGVELTGPADEVKVTIRDAAGNAVRTIHMGAQEAGTIPLAWDGKMDNGTDMANGKYSFEVAATLGKQSTPATGLSFGQVMSVSTGSQGIKINVPGLGEINFSDVRQIL